jgi:hypothetical protein
VGLRRKLKRLKRIDRVGQQLVLGIKENLALRVNTSSTAKVLIL